MSGDDAMTTGLRARPATTDDVPAIREIYNAGIRERVATFETTERSDGDIQAWLDTDYPVVVVEQDGTIVAWASASSYRPRACYAGICEFSVYVHPDHRGIGAGTVAMRALITESQRRGYEKLVSRIFVENVASRAMMRKLGFREVGIYNAHARLDGVWRDVVIVELLLQSHAGEPHGALWQPDGATLAQWDGLDAGMRVMVEKRALAGGQSALYSGTVMESPIPEPWREIRCEWTMPSGEVAGVSLAVGDELREYFSPRHPYNAFAIYSPEGDFKGWYGNVTWPALLEQREGLSNVVWRDLFLDIVQTPDGKQAWLDEDELMQSDLPATNPDIHRQILAARDELVRMLADGYFPLRQVDDAPGTA